MNRDDSRQLDAVVVGVLDLLAESVVGLYSYGSAVLGGLHPHSDLDVLAVVDRPTTHNQRRSLLAEIMSISGSRGTRIPGRPVELTVVLQGMVKPWRPDQGREFQYGEWLRPDYEAGAVPEPQTDHDLSPLLAAVLTASKVLVGRPAQEVIDNVPMEGLVAAMRHAVPQLLADLNSDTTNVLLTLARMWRTKDNGLIVSKSEGAAWAVGRLPHHLRPPLEHARTVYLSGEDESFDQLSVSAESTAAHICTVIRG